MLITYLRSSSDNKYDWCQHSYFLNYVLGINETANQKAEKGNIVHKALELLGLAKKAEQENSSFFIDDGLGAIQLEDCKPLWCLQQGYDFYTKDSIFEYTTKDFDECVKLLNTVLEFNNGMFNPQKLNILDCEIKFDIPIEKEWAKFEYDINGKVVEGYLSIKGTIDLVHINPNGIIEIIDWKTGQRKDWNTGEKKDYNKLLTDRQLLLYYYAARKLFPDLDHIMVTIYFIRDNKPYSVYFDDLSVERTEQLIKSRFEHIKQNQKPSLDISWKCKKLCHFGKNKYKDTDKTICEHFRDEIIIKGMDNVVKENIEDFSHIMEYGDGGGRVG